MSHGPKITVTHNELTRKEKKEIKRLMKAADVATEEERLAVAEYLNEHLKPMNGTLFGFWNHRPGQDVEDYDDLIALFKLYAKIIAKIKVEVAIVTADHKDHRWMYDADIEYVIDETEAVDNSDWFKEVELKRKVREGEEAREKLDKNLNPEGEAD